MNINEVKIVADSSADHPSIEGVGFESAPLKIITDKKEYTDDINLDVEDMVNDLYRYKGKSSSSCPNMEDWIEKFGDAKYVFCVTITGTLSGSYNTACLAREMYEEKYPERRVYVIDSLSAGPELKLIIEKLESLIIDGRGFDEICTAIEEYRRSTGLLFMLESMKNLANNGRVSTFTAKAAGILGIRVVGKASNKGDLEPLDKCRGEQKAIETIVKRLRELGYWGGKLRIAHCFNDGAAKELCRRIESEFANPDIEVYACRGLCSFYAEKGGMLIGFEKS